MIILNFPSEKFVLKALFAENVFNYFPSSEVKQYLLCLFKMLMEIELLLFRSLGICWRFCFSNLFFTEKIIQQGKNPAFLNIYHPFRVDIRISTVFLVVSALSMMKFVFLRIVQEITSLKVNKKFNKTLSRCQNKKPKEKQKRNFPWKTTDTQEKKMSTSFKTFHHKASQ